MQRFPILGTRGSPLALVQAHKVASALEVANRWTADYVQIQVVETTGDKVQDRPLAEIGGKQLWTKELDRALNFRKLPSEISGPSGPPPRFMSIRK